MEFNAYTYPVMYTSIYQNSQSWMKEEELYNNTPKQSSVPTEPKIWYGYSIIHCSKQWRWTEASQTEPQQKMESMGSLTWEEWVVHGYAAAQPLSKIAFGHHHNILIYDGDQKPSSREPQGTASRTRPWVTFIWGYAAIIYFRGIRGEDECFISTPWFPNKKEFCKVPFPCRSCGFG